MHVIFYKTGFQKYHLIDNTHTQPGPNYETPCKK